ncbi:neuronal acetylcholine receptor subunit alpha-7-like isoform X2 [Ptychodera flava]
MATLRLVTTLMSNYSKTIRPVASGVEPVIVRYGIALQQIIDMDERNQILTTNVWLRQHWNDVHFLWNPSDYDGVKTIRIPITDLWRPDIILYNNADDAFKGIMKTNAEIQHDGSVSWYAPAIFKSSCKVDIRYFPFDTQYCKLRIGSWTFAASSLQLVNRSKAGDVDSFISNGEWKLLGMPVVREDIYYPCCPDDPYNILTFSINIRRRSLFYVINLIVPCMLVVALTMMDFYLPADSGEKITLCITILLSLSVFILLVVETLPPTSEVVPLISAYYMSTMVLVTVSTFFTILVLVLHHHGANGKRAPLVLRKLTFEVIAPFLCRGQCKNSKDKETCLEYKMDGSLPELNVHIYEHNFSGQMDTTEQKVMSIGSQKARLQYVLNDLTSHMHDITKKLENTDAEEEIVKEWKEVALVLDRLFMLIFGVTTFISTCAIIFQAPSFE